MRAWLKLKRSFLLDGKAALAELWEGSTTEVRRWDKLPGGGAEERAGGAGASSGGAAQETTKMLLEWNKDIIKQADRSTGSTPLHFAASWGKHDVVRLLLDADASAAYQADRNGLFPIHVAASANKIKVVLVLLDRLHDCAELRDAKGRTFLHVAVQEESLALIRYACGSKRHKFASSLMNMQDGDGNTALHLAAEVGNLMVFGALMNNRLVRLNVTNIKGQAPFDVSWINLPPGVHYGLNPRARIYRLLRDAGAHSGTYRRDHFHRANIPTLDQMAEVENISTSTQTVGFSSVLIATVAFAAAFTLPGGYRADDHDNGGTPTLAGHFAFNVFIIANTLAFIVSGLSIAGLITAGVDTTVNILTRMRYLSMAAALMTASARSLAVAFAFGLYVVLAPVVRVTAMASLGITALALVLVDGVWFAWTVYNVETVLIMRLGVGSWRQAGWRRLACAILTMSFSQFWPYYLIAFVATCTMNPRSTEVIDLE